MLIDLYKASSVIALTMVLCTPAFAQDGLVEENESQDTIVVVGEKLGRSLQETSTSVGRVSTEDIDNIAAFDAQQAFERLVNVNTEGANGGFVIRGVAFDDVSNSGSIGALGVFYIDGVRLSQRGLRFGPDLAWDIDSIEVLRGAQSTLQGRNALAGAVHIRTKEPTYDWKFSARVLGAEGDAYGIAAAIGGPLIEDKLAFRVAAEWQDSDGFVTNPVLGVDNADFSENLVIRGKLLFEPTDNVRIDAVVNYADISQYEQLSDSRSLNAGGFIDIDPASVGASPATTSVGTLRRETLTNIRDVESTETIAALLRATWDINDSLTVTSETAFSRDRSLTTRDNDSGVFDFSSTGLTEIPFQDPLGISRFELTDFFDGVTSIPLDPIFLQEETNEIFSQEVRLNYDSGGRLKGLVGAYYTNENEDEVSYTQQVFTGVQLLIQPAALDAVGDPGLAGLVTSLYPNFVPLYVLSNEPVGVDNYSFFAELDYAITDRLTFTAGFRYDRETLNVAVLSSGELIGFPDPATAAATVENATGGGSSGSSS